MHFKFNQTPYIVIRHKSPFVVKKFNTTAQPIFTCQSAAMFLGRDFFNNATPTQDTKTFQKQTFFPPQSNLRTI